MLLKRTSFLQGWNHRNPVKNNSKSLSLFLIIPGHNSAGSRKQKPKYSRVECCKSRHQPCRVAGCLLLLVLLFLAKSENQTIFKAFVAISSLFQAYKVLYKNASSSNIWKRRGKSQMYRAWKFSESPIRESIGRQNDAGEIHPIEVCAKESVSKEQNGWLTRT